MSRPTTLNAVLWVEALIASITVAARIWTRKYILNSLGWDDLMLFLTLLCMLSYSICWAIGTAFGIGLKTDDIHPVTKATEGLKLELVGQAICILNIVFSKGAVAFFLLRIIVEKWQRILVWAVFTIVSAVSVLTSVALFVQCRPVQRIWNPNVPGSCDLNFTAIGISCSAFAVAADFTLALFPCVIIKNLTMKRKDKATVLCGMGLGVFAGLCGILRTIALTSLSSEEDYLYHTTSMLIYSATENFVSLVCASIPVLRLLYTRIVHGSDLSGHSTGNKNGYRMDEHVRGHRGENNEHDDEQNGLYHHHARIMCAKTTRQKSSHPGLDDNISEESILRDAKLKQSADTQFGENHHPRGITRADEVTVSFSRRQ